MTPKDEIVDVITGRSTAPGSTSHIRIHFQAHEDLDVLIQTWVDSSLKVGMELSRQQMRHLEQKALESEATEEAFRFLRSRPRTEREVRDRLAKAEYPEAVIEQVIADLIEREFVNDEDYTDRFISAYGSRMSRRELQYRLRKKGIETELAQPKLNAESSRLQEHDAALLLARKHWRKHRQRTLSERKQKLAQYLNMKGFHMDLIYDVLNELEAETQENERS